MCRREERVLITLDVGFADIRQYPPSKYPGIVVLRLPRPNPLLVPTFMARLVQVVKTHDLSGRLWIVTARGVRIRQDHA